MASKSGQNNGKPGKDADRSGVLVGCGVLMIAGFRARAAASVLALFCVATAVFFHTDFADPNQIFHFIKNIVMTGGLLQIVAFGAGAFSIDNRHHVRSPRGTT